MRKPGYPGLPRPFRGDYAKFAALRLAGSAVLLCAAAVCCFLIDFSGLRYPPMGPVFLFGAAIAVCCVLFGLHRFLKPGWRGTVTEIDCGIKTVAGNKGQPDRRMMVDLTVDRGTKKPYTIRLFREEGVTHGGTKINVFQEQAPYKEGDTLLYLPGFRYPARVDVKDAGETLDPKFVCPFCGAIGPLSKTACPTCGRTVLR